MIAVITSGVGWISASTRIVVVGDEGAGKSTILEQLAKLPLLPRRRTVCTRLAIHVRLRRCPDESSVTLAVYKVTARGETLEKGPEPRLRQG
eukprot:s9136_g1.t1